MARPEFHGLIVVDKPCGVTSRAAVNRCLSWFPRGTRVGHTGTLDPQATGVLVLCVGKATRLAEYVQDMDKEYRAGLFLGARSTTDDSEGDITPSDTATPMELTAIDVALSAFVGDIEQVPPIHSAILVDGQRAYDLARKGRDVQLKARTVRVYRIDVVRYEFPHLELDVRCGKGTYIRSLARDLGESLGCGAYLTSLRRTRVGSFVADGALSPEAERATAQAALLPWERALDGLPRWTLPARHVDYFTHGTMVPLDEALSGEVLVVNEAGKILGTGCEREGMLQPIKVLDRA